MKNVNARIGNGVTQKKALFFRGSSTDGGKYIIDNVYNITNLISVMFFIKTDFFGEKFEIIIQELQVKYIDDNNGIEREIDDQQRRIELLERNNLDQDKKDMWED